MGFTPLILDCQHLHDVVMDPRIFIFRIFVGKKCIFLKVIYLFIILVYKFLLYIGDENNKGSSTNDVTKF